MNTSYQLIPSKFQIFEGMKDIFDNLETIEKKIDNIEKKIVKSEPKELKTKEENKEVWALIITEIGEKVSVVLKLYTSEYLCLYNLRLYIINKIEQNNIKIPDDINYYINNCNSDCDSDCDNECGNGDFFVMTGKGIKYNYNSVDTLPIEPFYKLISKDWNYKIENVKVQDA